MLSDSDDMIRKKIKKAPTDAIRGITYDIKERPGVANLVAIYAALREIECEAAATELRECSNAQLKEAVAETVVQFVGPVRSEMQRLLADAGHLEQILARNEQQVNDIANANWKEIAACVGLQ
ncbi:Tryptophan--tRNA ligase, mitochondrial [Linderina macrospora]|uniref:Tryptophan--tRNA ligase, mitochondrial n=1 Tax=Linderina macrospora TaxID=4868 RepID=A0ACC1J1H6_9FUNG|nr:Tryptophan--tRNA ligase, mitochondrial [Linderina macrospora]